MSAAVDLERLRRAKEQALSYAQARLSGASTAPPPVVPMLPPYFGEEGPGRDLVIAQQRRAIRQWIKRNALIAVVRREIDESCAAALAAEGLT